jgi:hypothetical protein
MHENEALCRQNVDQNDEGQGHDGVTARFASAAGPPCPLAVKKIVDACRSLGADALALELPDQVIVAVVNVYDGAYTAAICQPDAPLASVVRGLQLWLYSGQGLESYTAYLPAATVISALGCWERQIALVFGRQYAAMLVASAGKKAAGEVSRDDLESIRLLLSSAIGGCVLLQKVDK